MAFAPQTLPSAQFLPPPVQQPNYYYPLGPPSPWTQPPSYPAPYFSNPPGPPTPQYGEYHGNYPAPPNGGFPHHYQQHYLPAPGPRPYFRGRGCGRGVTKRLGGDHFGRGRGMGVAKSPGGGHFECKVCTKEYKSRETYDTHIKSHQKCSKCDFSAVPRVLKEHELIHILPDCLKFYSPEEIQKWREERKKNFPTSENVALKVQIAAEKTARGETALTPLHRYIRQLVGEDDDRRGGRGRKRGRGRFRGRGTFRGRGSRGRVHNLEANQEEGNLEANQEEGNLEANQEEGNLESGGVSSACGGNSTGHVTNDPVTSAPVLDGDKDGVHEDGECIPGEGIVDAILADAACQHSDQSGHAPRPLGGEGVNPESVATNSVEGEKVGARKRKQKWASRQENKRRKFVVPKLEDVPIRKATLLEKLLAIEVRKEQNILLQCIRYIVDTEFLGHRGKPPGGEEKGEVGERMEGKVEVGVGMEGKVEVGVGMEGEGGVVREEIPAREASKAGTEVKGEDQEREESEGGEGTSEGEGK